MPVVAIIFSIIAIGADEAAGAATENGKTYLTAAYSLYGHLVAKPHLSSVQALLLLGFALRARSKDGQCWQLTGQAIRIAHSIGLHRQLSFGSCARNDQNLATATTNILHLEARVWWSCYALERVMELETGRPSAITEQEIDQVGLPHSLHQTDLSPTGRGSNQSDTVEARGGSTGPLDLFLLWISLARLMGQISEHLYRKHATGPWQLLYETGRLDQALLEWVKTVPEGIQPGHHHEIGLVQQGEPHYEYQNIATFLSLQYHHAQITLFRASLVFPTEHYLDEVKRQHAIRPLPSYLRLLQSQNMCISAARATARQVLEMADHDVNSKHLFAPTQPFLATVALGLHVLKHPGKRMTRSDVELLVGTTEYIEAFYHKIGQSTEFVQGCERLKRSILEAVAADGPGSWKERRDSQLLPEPGRHIFASGDLQNARAYPSSGGMDGQMTDPGQQPSIISTEMNDRSAFLDPYGGMTLEELWTSMSSDFIMGEPLDFSNALQ